MKNDIPCVFTLCKCIYVHIYSLNVVSQTLNPARSFNAYQFETVNGNVIGVGRFIIEYSFANGPLKAYTVCKRCTTVDEPECIADHKNKATAEDADTTEVEGFVVGPKYIAKQS